MKLPIYLSGRGVLLTHERPRSVPKNVTVYVIPKWQPDDAEKSRIAIQNALQQAELLPPFLRQQFIDAILAA